MALLNARSIVNKTFLINDFILSRGLDFLFVTETWLNVDEIDPLFEMAPESFNFLSTPREKGRGGGVATIFKKCFKCRMCSVGCYSSFEVQLFKIDLVNPVLCALIYRPPKYNKVFISEFSDFLSTVISSTDSLLILGDFNIHICCPEKLLVKEFLDLVDSFSLMQSVLEPTHSHGHTLDLILSFGFPIHNVETADTLLSDHKPVIFNASFTASLFGNLQSCKPVGKWLRAINPSTASQFVEAYSIAETSRSTSISFFGNVY